MKRFFVIAVLAGLFFVSCSKIELSGIYATKFQGMPEMFSSIVIEGPMDVETSLEYDMIEISSDANVLPYVEIFEKDAVLHIKYKDGVRFGSGPLGTEIKLPYRQGVNSVSISGASTYESDVVFDLAGLLDLEASGASKFEFPNVIASKMVLNLSGASSFEASSVTLSDVSLNLSGASAFRSNGRIVNCRADLSGASSINQTDRDGLEIINFNGDLSGASVAMFSTDGNISATLSGASFIYYYGNPTFSITNTISGGSDIVPQE